MSPGKRLRALFLVSILAISVLAAGVGPVAAEPTDEIRIGGDDGLGPIYGNGTVTVAAHPGEKGYSHDAMAGVYDDQGNWISDPAWRVNTSQDAESAAVNRYSFVFTDLEDESLGAFPRTGDDVDDSALNASQWSTVAGASNVSISDTETGPAVEAVRFDTGTSGGVGEVAKVKFNRWDGLLDSDESKRYLQLAADVDTLDSAAEVQIRVYDESGDYKQVVINSSESYSSDSVLANGTGEGYVLQTKLADLPTNGGGAWANIENVTVRVVDGDADVSFSWIDLERKGELELAKEKVETSDDDDLFDDTRVINDSFKGSISTYSMETLPAEFDDAVVHDVTYPAVASVALLDEEGQEADYVVQFDDAGKYNADTILNASFRIEFPDYIDLSWSGLSIKMDQGWPSADYIELGINEGAGDTKFSEISYSDKTGSLGDIGDTVTLDGSVSAGTAYAVHVELGLSESAATAMKNTGGGGGGPVGQGTSFWQNPILWLAGMIGSALGGVIGRVKGIW